MAGYPKLFLSPSPGLSPTQHILAFSYATTYPLAPLSTAFPSICTSNYKYLYVWKDNLLLYILKTDGPGTDVSSLVISRAAGQWGRYPALP